MSPFAEAAAKTSTAAPGSIGLFVTALGLLSALAVGMPIVDAYRRLDRRFMQLAAPWIYVLLPGVALHELAHVLGGRRYGDVEIDWTRPHVDVDWNDTVPVWGVFGFFLAPLVAGGLVAFTLPLAFPLVPAAVDVWLVANWLLLAGPSVLDARGLVLTLAGG